MADEPNPQHSPIFGNAEYEAAIDTILQKASSRIRIFDHTLGKEYNSSRRLEVLRQFLLASRRNSLQVVLHDTRTMDRNCPRILRLLRTYGHSISIHETHPTAKSVYDPFVIVDDEWIVDRLGRRMGLVNADRVSVCTQQTQYPRTVAIHGPGIVKHDLQAVAPACEQKLPQHFEAAGGVVFLSQRVIENADSARGFLQDRVDCRFVFGIAEDRRVLRVGFVCHRSQPAGPDLDKQI